MLEAATIPNLHQHLTEAWHEPRSPSNASPPEDPLAALITAQHRENFDLWHEEDKARDPSHRRRHRPGQARHRPPQPAPQRPCRKNRRVAPRQPAPAKPRRPAQLRDPRPHHRPPLHPRPPHLPHPHEAHRDSASEAHRHRNTSRLALLEEQRNDLAGCLDALWPTSAPARGASNSTAR